MTNIGHDPETIAGPEELDDLLSRPSESLCDMMRRLEGDIIILGIAGKMGLTLGRRAVSAVQQAGVGKKVIGVSRFSTPSDREKLEAWGVETVACDLLDREAVRKLPLVPNVIFMAGRKFGTGGAEDLTWAMNVLAPWHVAEHYRSSRIVAFSTGCVYPLRSVSEGGCVESDLPAPVGEYSQSCLRRERVFEYAARVFGTKSLLFRLNYAIDLRYGVLHVTGPETASTRQVALELGRWMDKPVRFTDTFSDAAYLNNAGLLHGVMGSPSVSLSQLIRWQAEWTRSGGESLGKPTHFEVNDGKF